MGIEGMNKIPRAAAKHLNNLSTNELVVIPDEGDFGFGEYMTEKTSRIISQKRLRTSIERNLLLLRYPAGENTEMEMRRFFISPKICAEHGIFQGCFVVDITDYRNRMDSERFQNLLSYIRENREIHFILLLFEKDRSKADQVYSFLNSKDYFDKVTFSYPSAERIAEYITEKFSEHTLEQVSPETCKLIIKLLEGERYEYDYADRLVDELIYTGCSSDITEIQKTLTDVLFRKKADSERAGDRHQIGFVSTRE